MDKKRSYITTFAAIGLPLVLAGTIVLLGQYKSASSDKQSSQIYVKGGGGDSDSSSHGGGEGDGRGDGRNEDDNSSPGQAPFFPEKKPLDNNFQNDNRPYASNDDFSVIFL